MEYSLIYVIAEGWVRIHTIYYKWKISNEELKTELEWKNIQMNYLLAPRRKKTRS